MRDLIVARIIRRGSPLLAASAPSLILSGCQTALMDPQGAVGAAEKSLILTSTGLMLIVVLPVIALTLIFAFWFRASNKRAAYRPDWVHSTRVEVVVWSVPCVIVVLMSILAWKSTHDLDPYRPLPSSVPPIRVDVVALDWKWLFVYPDRGIATVNRLVVPVGAPIEFRVTSDSVMNSFFIPRLGGQIYAMAGMTTQLHLVADHPGTYDGMSANYSGRGFSGMKFKAVAGSSQEFEAWVEEVRRTGRALDARTYAELAAPSENNPVETFAKVDPGLFDGLIAKYLNGPDKAGTDHHMKMN